MAKIPERTVSSTDRARLQTLDSELKEVVYGQDPAIDAVARAIKLARSGLAHPDRPVGAFLFAGPTGVGKTEVARQLAKVMGVEFIRFDMSEYMERHTVSRLIGAPPGYVGFDQGGLLTDAINKTPHCVLLLDEIEKAHPDLFNILLQVMDHATLTDNNGRKADFRNVILVMTTNAGAQELSRAMIGFRRRYHHRIAQGGYRSDVLAGIPQPAIGDYRVRAAAARWSSNAWWINSCSNFRSGSKGSKVTLEVSRRRRNGSPITAMTLASARVRSAA